MFICEKCNKVSEPGEKPARVVVETRKVEYINHGNISRGTEIVKEANYHEACK